MSYPPPPGLPNSASSASTNYAAPGTTTHSLPPRPSGPPPSFRAFNAPAAASPQGTASGPPASAFAFRPRQVAAPPTASHITHSAQPTTYSSGYSQSGYTGGASYGATGYGNAGHHPHAQTHAQYPAAAQYGQPPTTTGAPHIVNPFPLPSQQTYGQGHGGPAGSAGSGNAAARGRHNNQPYDPRYPPLDPETEAQIAQQQSIYIPADQQAQSANSKNGRTGGGITGSNNTALGPLNPAFGGATAGGNLSAGPTSENGTPLASTTPQPQQSKEKQPTVIRSGGGQTWSDPTLLEWDPAHFRLFVGNLAGEVTDESLLKAFSKYPSVQKARVIRDKRTTKSKGFGFVSFSDGDEYFRAAREMNGKYIGSHPVLLKRSNTEIRPVIPGDKKNKKGGGSGGGGANLGVQSGGIKKKVKKNKVPERKVLG